MRKIPLLIAGAAGYVLGTKAGRTRYEQIRQAVRRVAGDPRVRSAAHHAQETVQDKAPAVKEKVAAAAEKVRPSHGDRAAGVSGLGGLGMPGLPAPGDLA